MEQKVIIRNEDKKDWEKVERITREAFYNLYVPGCAEHFLVHIMRAQLAGHQWIYRDSPVMAINEEEARRYDDTLEPMEKKYLPTQDEFYIMSHSFVE